MFECVACSQVLAILRRESVLAHDLGEIGGLTGPRRDPVQLRRDLQVVLTRAVRAGAVVHQARERGERVERRRDAARVELGAQHELSFGDVPGHVRDGMGDVAGGHGQHRELGE